MATVRCPSCDRALEVLDAYRDWTVRCPHCGEEFVPDAVGTGTRRPRPREEPDDRDEEDFDRDEVPEETREEALRIVAAPATWLEIVGWFSALAALGLCALCLVLAIEINNNPNPNPNPNGEDELFFLLLGGCAGVLGVPYSVAMALGARKMRDLSSRGWAMTAGILGVAAFSVFGLFGVIQAGFGAWALVTLDNPKVRIAHGLEPRRRPNPHRRDRDD